MSICNRRKYFSFERIVIELFFKIEQAQAIECKVLSCILQKRVQNLFHLNGKVK